MSAADLAILLRLKDEASAGLEKLGGSLGKMAGLVATGVAAAGSVAAAGIGASVVAAADFEKTLSAVKAVSGATAQEMSQLSGLALQLGKDTSFSASEAAAGIEELVKGGLSIPDIMNGAAKSMLDLAAAGGVSLPDAATIAANALAQFNLKGEDMAHVADLIAGAANASALDVSDFKFSLQAAGAVASTVGFNFDDLAQAIAVMGKAGITGSDAGTSLKTMMMNLIPQTDKQIGLFRRLGILTGDNNNAFFDASGKVKSMAEVAQILQDALGGLTEQQRLVALETMFGSDAIRAGAVLTKEGAAGFRDMADAMGKVTAAQVGAERLNNLAGSFEQMKGSLETLGITFGMALLPVLREGVDAATGFVNSLIPLAEEWGPRVAEGVTTAVGAVRGAIGPLLDIAGDVGRTIMQALGGDWSPDASIDPIVNAVGMVTVALRGLFAMFSGDSMSTGELFNLAGVLTTLFGPAATSMILDFARLAGEAFRAFADATMAAVGGVVAWFTENWPLIQQIGAQVVMGLAVLWETHGANIVTAVQSVWTMVTKLIEGGADLIGSVVRALMQVFTGDVGGALETMGGLFERQWARVGQIVSAAVTGLAALLDIATGGMLTTVGQWLTDTQQSITTGMALVADEIEAAWLKVQGFIPGLLGGIRDAILAVWNLLPEDIRRDLVLIATHIVTQGAVWATNIATAGAAMATNIATKLGEMVTAVTTWATVTFLGPITAMVEPVGAEAAKVGGGMLTAVTTKLGEIITELGTWATNFLAPITALIATAGAEAGKIGSAIVERIASAISGGLQAIRSAAYSAARAALDSAMSVLGVPSGGGGGDGGEEIEGRAIGGPVSQGVPYWVGERGPELFVPGMSGAIVPTGALGASSGAAFAGGGVNITFGAGAIQVNGSVLTDRDLQEVIGQAVDDSLRYGGRLGRYG